MKGSKIILAALIVIFILAGGYLILLSQGFMFDSEKLQIVKTGAIFLLFEPRDTKVMLDGKIQKVSSPLFNNSVLIDRLLPDAYEITLSKEGFRQWQKKAVVEPGLVTEFQKIILVPNEIEITPIVDGTAVDDFAIAEKGLIYKKGKNLLLNTGLLRGEQIATADSRSPLVVSVNINGAHFLTDLNNPKSALNLNELFNSLKQRQLDLAGVVPLRKIWIHPFNPNKLLLATDATLYELDVKKIKLEILLFFENKIAASVLNQNELLLADVEGNLIFYNFLFKSRALRPTGLTNISKIESDRTSGKIGIQTENGDFFIYDRTRNKVIETPFHRAKSFLFTPDSRHIIILTKSGKVKVFAPDKNKLWELGLPAGEVREIAGIPQSPNYILATIENNLILSEIQSGHPTNWYQIVKAIKKHQFQDKISYILKDNGELLTFPPLLGSPRFP
jgi:hypothetical protein